MGYTRPQTRKKCTLVLLDESGRPIVTTAKKMYGGVDKAHAYGQVYKEDYNNKRTESDPVASSWLVSV